MKQTLKLSILLFLLIAGQKLVAQDVIIMGSTPLVMDIDDQPRFFYDPGGVPGYPGDNNDPDGYFAQGLNETMTLRTGVQNTWLYVLFEEFAMSEGDTLWIYDGDASNPLRVIEKLHYHCYHEPRYIQELKTALREKGIIPDNRKQLDLFLKDDFKETRLYKKGLVFVNERKKLAQVEDDGTIGGAILSRVFKVMMPTGKMRSGLISADLPVCHGPLLRVRPKCHFPGLRPVCHGPYLPGLHPARRALRLPVRCRSFCGSLSCG